MREAGTKKVEISIDDFENAVTMDDIVNTETGEVVAEAGAALTAEKLQQVVEEGVQSFTVIFPEKDDMGTILTKL